MQAKHSYVTYVSASSFKQKGHIKSIYEVRTVKCNVCCKSFKTNSSLKQHIKLFMMEKLDNCSPNFTEMGS